jgi:hypothetical protein
MNRATATFSKTLAILAGVTGIVHGIGEVLQGFRPTESLVIQSWPDSRFFEILSGEPAMTIFPNYFLAGLFAIFFSTVFLALFLKSDNSKKAILIHFSLLLAMLLSGAGFGPPLVGFFAQLIALKKDSALESWSKLPIKFYRILSQLWPWFFSINLLGWLGLFPGASIISFFAGIDHSLIVIIPFCMAFLTLPITLFMAYSFDIIRRK